jgi:hypothetical protein
MFLVAMVVVSGAAFLRGGHDEKAAAASILLAAVATPFVVSQSFGGPERGIVFVDVALFGALLLIAMRSAAFWPLWAAGFQLCGVAVHVAAAKSPHMLPAAYADTMAIWAYPVMASVLIGTVVEGDRRRGQR